MSRPRVVVAGGSIGGLSAALWLRDAGCDVDVYERSPVPLEGLGAGIVLNPATVRWFERHGDGAAVGVAVSELRYLGADGRVAARLAHRYGFTSYDTLYRRLVAAFGRERYHLGEEVVPGEDGAVRLAARADLVVWADGVRSVGRRRLVPGARPRYAGYVAWRGTLSPEALPPATAALFADAITYCVLPRSHALIYPIPHEGGARLNWLWYRNVAAPDALMTDRAGRRREVSVPPGAVADEHVAGLRRDASGALPAPLAELVSHTHDPFIQAVFDVEVPRMAFGRECLIGDAAFAARPHAAVGSAKAAEDGYRLGAAMRESGGDVAAALARWEPPQLALGRDVLRRTKEAGDRSQFHGTWKVGDPLPFGLYETGDSLLAPRRRPVAARSRRSPRGAGRPTA